MAFEISCDESGQFFVNGKPVDRRGCGWRQSPSGRWYYSREANVIDRLETAIENGDVTSDEVYGCKNHAERKLLWEKIKTTKRIGGGTVAGHPVYLDPAASCAEAVERLSKEQPVNRSGPWYGSTICFTGQMFDRTGNKITRKKVREISNEIGFVWLERVTIGCVFLVTGEYKTLTSKTQKAMRQGCGLLSLAEFWDLVEDVKGSSSQRSKFALCASTMKDPLAIKPSGGSIHGFTVKPTPDDRRNIYAQTEVRPDRLPIPGPR